MATSQLAALQQEKSRSEDALPIKQSLVWRNLVFLILNHVGAVYAVTLVPSLSWWVIGLWPLGWALSSVGVTMGAHRLWSHKSYKTVGPVRAVLMLLNSLAYQGPLYEWVRDHRTHHKASETDGDPHNASRGFFFAHMGWVVVKKHPEVIRVGKTIDMSDIEADKIVMWQKKYYLATVAVMCYGLPTLLGYVFANDAWGGFWFGAVFRHQWVLHVTWMVNSVAHMYGDTPYDAKISPRESPFVSVLAFGEGWHNYHHALPYDYSASEWGGVFSLNFRYNPTTVLIDGLAALGLVWDRRKAASSLVEKMKERARQSTSQHVEGRSTPNTEASSSVGSGHGPHWE